MRVLLANPPTSSIIPLMSENLTLATAWLNLAPGAVETPPGLGLFNAPRKTARGREKDVLLVGLSLRGRTPPPPTKFQTLVTLTTTTFFNTPGTVTAALRQAVTVVNQTLLDENLRANAEAGPLQGGLICAVVHGPNVYVSASGPGLFLLARPDGVEPFPTAAPRPLGSSHTPDAQYFHATLNAGDYCALSNAPAKGWGAATLLGLGNLTTLSAVVERLKNTAQGEGAALIVRVEASASPVTASPTASAPAAGLAEFLRLRPRNAAPAPEAPPAPVAARSPAAAQIATEAPATDSPVVTDWQNLIRRAEKLSKPEEAGQKAEGEKQKAEGGKQEIGARSQEAEQVPQSAINNQKSSILVAFTRALRNTLAAGLQGVRGLLGRMLPAEELHKDGHFVVPDAVARGVAILVPALVALVALLLFFQRGAQQQLDDTVALAQQAIINGRQTAAQDPVKARPYWEEALKYATQASTLQPNAEADALRREAQTHLDELDWVTRLNYQPLIPDGLGAGVKIKRILLVGEEVYLLDEGQNRILRLTRAVAGTQYAVDTTFQCAGGQPVGPVQVGVLIDLLFVPGPNLLSQAGGIDPNTDAIVALDSLGALLYCAPGLTKPLASYLEAPDTGWVRPTSVELYGDRLYVLDPGSNQIWQFQASGGAFTQPAVGYFTQFVYDLADVTEFAIASGEVFLQRRDGRAALCSRSNTDTPATCVEVVQYSDPRPGQAAGERLFGVTNPRQLLYDPPPEPSLYLLEPGQGAVYQLSLKLAFVRQFRPQLDLPLSPVVGVGVDTAKRLFLATEDNIYVAQRP